MGYYYLFALLFAQPPFEQLAVGDFAVDRHTARDKVSYHIEAADKLGERLRRIFRHIGYEILAVIEPAVREAEHGETRLAGRRRARDEGKDILLPDIGGHDLLLAAEALYRGNSVAQARRFFKFKVFRRVLHALLKIRERGGSALFYKRESVLDCFVILRKRHLAAAHAAALTDKEIEARAALPEVAREHFVALRQAEYFFSLVDGIARGERAHIRTDILRAVVLALEHGIYVAPLAGRDFYI